MGLLDKVKNFFYDEEDAEDFEPVVQCSCADCVI